MNTKSEKISNWYVYIVHCDDGTLYTGITIDLNRRIQEHNSMKCGARYTRSRRPVELVYFEPIDSRSGALKREYQVRTLRLQKKRELVLASYKNQKDKNPDIKIPESAIRKIRNP